MFNLLREPLLHFLAAGMLLFALFDWLAGSDQAGARQIVVDDNGLVALLGYRNPRVGPVAAREYLDGMSPEDRRRLVDDFVREEVLYREAVELGLDDNNYSARRRLITQLEYINQGFIYDSLQLDEQDLADFYLENQERYRVASQITFTHVYFSADRLGQQGALDSAASELQTLNAQAIAFHRAASRGDHFLYHRNYVNKNREEVASHFGTGFADRVFELEAQSQWQGPFTSAYGVHLVMVTSLKPAYIPGLEEVRARVADDLAQQRVAQAMEDVYQQALGRYTVNVVAGPDPDDS